MVRVNVQSMEILNSYEQFLECGFDVGSLSQ